MDDVPQVTCPECDERFVVIYSRSATSGDGPEYCPFCAAEIDYAANLEE